MTVSGVRVRLAEGHVAARAAAARGTHQPRARLHARRPGRAHAHRPAARRGKTSPTSSTIAACPTASSWSKSHVGGAPGDRLSLDAGMARRGAGCRSWPSASRWCSPTSTATGARCESLAVGRVTANFGDSTLTIDSIRIAPHYSPNPAAHQRAASRSTACGLPVLDFVRLADGHGAQHAPGHRGQCVVRREGGRRRSRKPRPARTVGRLRAVHRVSPSLSRSATCRCGVDMACTPGTSRARRHSWSRSAS